MIRVVLTPGDPRGIGPEVLQTAVTRYRQERPDVELVPIGPEDAGTWDGTEAGAGRVSAAAIRVAVERCLSGEAQALVTGPIHKPALQAAGLSWPGHTEMLRDLAGVERVGMLMAAERTLGDHPLRVLLATTHVALRDVPDLLTADLLVEQTLLLHHALRTSWGIPEPRIGLCALNPHASDDGLFGDEEARIYGPALDRIRGGGVPVREALPADSVFRHALDGRLDAVVAPYHDVGMAAFKTVSFGSGVNVTLGLPFVRTSPDHGTAFDIAGSGRADPSSMLEALRLAVRLSRA